MSTFFRKFRYSGAKGFTLVELLVVSAIILVITAFTLFQQGKFNSSTLLRSLAYSIALSMRQAQVYGTSVRESSLGSTFFSPGYGVYIPAAGTGADTYYIFSDTVPAVTGDGKYTDSSETSPSFTFKLGKGYYIKSVCAVTGSSCTNSLSLGVFFRRPNPDACISDNVDGRCAPGYTGQAYPTAFITVTSTGNSDTRSIKISNTGQIAVCALNAVPPAC